MKTTSISIWYRRKASGVQTTLRNMCGTGEGPLGYELHSETCSVQEKGLWGTNRTRNVFGTGDGSLGTNRTRNVFGTGDGSLGYEPHSKRVRYRRGGLWGTNYSPERVWYRRGASGVRTTLRNVCGTGEGPLGYELLSGTCAVQERGL